MSLITKRQLIISKPMTIEDLSVLLSGYIKSDSKPVLNVDEFYQIHRGGFVR